MNNTKYDRDYEICPKNISICKINKETKILFAIDTQEKATIISISKKKQANKSTNSH